MKFSQLVFFLFLALAACSPQLIVSPTLSPAAASTATVTLPPPTQISTLLASRTPIIPTMTPAPSSTPTITPTEDPYHPFPEQSPNGLYTARFYQNWPDPQRLAIFDAGGRMIWEVTSTLKTTMTDPSPSMKLVGWSKDGSSFYFCYQFIPDGGDYAFLWDGYDLQRLDIATGEVEQVVEDNGDLSFAFSPNGLFLAYARSGDEPESIIIRDLLSGKETRRILPAAERDIIRVGAIHWSPSNSGLVFLTEEEEWMVQTFFLDIQTMHLRLVRRYKLYELLLEGWENEHQVRYFAYPQNMILLVEPRTGQENILGTPTPQP